MTGTDIAWTAFAAVALGAWGIALTMLLLTRRAMTPLSSTVITRQTAWPRVSIVIPALNEAATLEAALASKLAVDYPDLEIVVVNDRSTDDTGAIAERVARADPRVKVVHIDALPDGWLGKVHALHQGARAATGELLLFSDADVHFAASAVKRAVQALDDGRYDFLTVLPQFLPVSLLTDAAVVAFVRVVASGLRVWDAEDPTKRHAVGVGAFSLVRRAALEQTEGFSWLKLEVADDVALALLLKQSGARCGVRDGRGEISLTFYPSTLAMVRAVEKQGYAILGRYSFVRTLAVSLLPLPFEWMLVVAALAPLPPLARALAFGCAVVQLVVGLLAARTASLPLAAGVLAPVGMTILAFAMVRSAVLGVWFGGVRWRGTVYPRDALAAGRRVSFP